MAKDICVDWCESTNCNSCIYKDADPEVREAAFYEFDKCWHSITNSIIQGFKEDVLYNER